MSRRWQNEVSKSLRDYMAPIIIIWIVLIIVLNFIFSWDENKKINNSVNTALSVEMKDSSKWEVTFSNGSKKDISSWEDFKLSKWEKIWVSEGNILLKDNSWNTFNLSKNWEFAYSNDDKNSSYVLYSANLWVKTSSGVNIDMRYANISSKWNSVFNLTQNEIASTIYVVSWNVEVKTLALKQTILTKWEQISIMRTNTNDSTYDLETVKEKIDQTDEWFLFNWWDKKLSSNDNNISSSWIISLNWSGNILSWSELISSNEVISFDNLSDEMIIKDSKLEITWKLLNDNIYKIDINWNIATLDNDEKTFQVDLNITKKVEDIVYKVYDDTLRVLQKWVITVYYDWWEENTQNNNSNTPLADVKNYSISKSPLYTIISPTKNPYTTTENVVRLEWRVPAKTVAKIFVNDFQLKKFPAYWSYWYYFANTDFGNLKTGVNMYEIKYFDSEDKILYTNNFVIIKEEPVIQTTNSNTWVNETNQTPVIETSSWTEVIPQ